MKKISIIVASLVVLTLLFTSSYFQGNISKLVPNANAVIEQAYVDVKIVVVQDGRAPFDTCGATCDDSDPYTDASLDGLNNNLLVRAGDLVDYRMELNVNGADSANVTGTVTVTNGTIVEIPSKCLTENSLPPVDVSKKSTLSADKKTLVCNSGMLTQGSTTYISVNVLADYALNGTDLNLSIIGTGDGAIPSGVKNAAKVEITAAPYVDIVDAINSAFIPPATTIYEGSYERNKCMNGVTVTDYSPSDPAACTGVGDIKGDIIIYNPTLRHSKLGSEKLANFDITMDMVMGYVSGHNGANNAVLVGCTKESGVGTLVCSGVGSAGLNKSVSMVVTGVVDNGVQDILKIATKWFIPKTDYTSPTVLNTTSLVTGRTTPASGFGDSGWDPDSVMPSNTSNYIGSTEYATTCTDPSSTSTCNNRADLPLQYPTPGFLCPFTITGYGGHYNYCGQYLPGLNSLSYGAISEVVVGASFYTDLLPSGTTQYCQIATIDGAGNKLLYLTGEPGDITDHSGSTWWVYNYNLLSYHSNPYPWAYTWTNRPPYDIVDQISSTAAFSDNINHRGAIITPYVYNQPFEKGLKLQFSTVPLSGSIPGTSDRLASCEDDLDSNPLTNDWIDWTSQGSVTSQVDYKQITRARVIYEWENYPAGYNLDATRVAFQVKVNPDKLTVDAFCATNPSSGCILPSYSSFKIHDTTNSGGFSPNPHTSIGDGGTFTNNELDAATATWLASNLQDAFIIVPASVSVQKLANVVSADPGDTVTYTVTPSFTGVATTDVTLVDNLESRLQAVVGSLVVIPATNDPVLSCPVHQIGNGMTATLIGQALNVTYINAKAGCNLPQIQYKAIVDATISNADLTNTVTIDTPNDLIIRAVSEGSEGAVKRTSSATIRVRTPGALNINKELVSAPVQEVGQMLEYKLNFKNVLDVDLGPQEYIEVFPYIGDEFNYQDRYGPSAYHGIVSFNTITDNDSQMITVMYTKQVPSMINQDPKCASNDSGTVGVWDLDGSANISSTNPQDTDWTLYCNNNDTPTVWCAGLTGGACPANPGEVTALKIYNPTALPVNQPARSFSIKLQTNANWPDDIYWNSWSGRSTSINLPVISNDVVSTVIGGELGNRVWNDINSDGVQDPTEPGIQNVKVCVVGTVGGNYGGNIDPLKLDPGPNEYYENGGGDDAQLCDFTDSSGVYEFVVNGEKKYFSSGVYTVTVDPTTNPYDVQTYDYDGVGTGNMSVTTLTNTGTDITDDMNQDFGYVGYKITGSLWYDSNEDGLHGVLPSCGSVVSPLSATECGLPAETLKLLDSAGNPVLDYLGNPITTVTNNLGYYEFINIPPGSYTVVETQPAGFGSSTPNTLPAVITNADVTGIDFGEVVGLLDGCVYVDANNDGVKDLGELPLVGVSITLTGNDVRGSVVNVNQLTDALGCYRFTGLLEGTYSVAEVQPVAYLDGKETAGTSGGQTTVNDVISNISLISGGESLQNNFGELYIGEIKGCVYADFNVNDIFDAGDQVIPAVVINLKDSGGVTIKTQTTDALGCYDFANLPNGTYSVEEIQPTTYLNGKNFINGGTVDGTDDLITGIVIAANVDPQNDFSEYPISGLSGIVYHDRNQSFTQMPDLNEEGLAGWTITLTSPLLGSPLTTVTDFQGRYNFPNLVPGSYTVTETQNPSFAGSYEIDNVQTVVVPPVPLTNVNFGEYLGVISCKVYRDINENNVFDNGTDLPMAGEEVKLVNGITSLVLQTALTDVNGDCLFIDLISGNYKVVETQPLGYASTQNPTNQVSVILPAGGNSAGNNFGETLASVSGHVFADINLNEILDISGPDTPIPAVTITLSGTDVRGGTVNAVTTTNALGYYEFKDLLAGQYNIVETQPINYVDSKDFVGDLGGILGADQVTRITILAGENGINYDFLEIPLADISGQVWYDKDRDSVKDEVVYIPGVTITLMRGSTVIATRVTDATGKYEFLQYPIGPYTIVETQPLGYASSTPDTISINLTMANSINNDYGETLSTIAGTVFADEDVSLSENAGDIYLSGVTITLVCTDAANMPVNLTMMTNASGDYKFEDLKSGVCTITETQPGLYGDSVDFVGSAGGTLGNDVISAITLPAGVDEVNYDFSDLYLEDISGHVWYDKDRDGVEDVTETTRVSGVTINLKDASGTVIATTTTDATGYYEFLDYKLGSYTVEEVQPLGYGSSTPDTIAVTLRRGGSINNNYGDTLSTIAGTVFSDEDVSLSENAGDIYLSGVTITLVCTDAASMPVNLTMMTDANGNYKFEDLKSGVCTITETQPGLYGDSVDFVGSAGGTLGNDVISAITLPAGVDEINYDFSDLYLEDILSHVWYDKDRDGVEDVTETTRISGVTINLKDSTGAVIATTTTDGTGYYEFLDYKLGSYTVEEVQPLGYGSSTANTIAVTLRRGGSINNNYGETLSTIAGTVFADEDVSLTENAGDIYLSGVTITLECIDAASMPVILSQATDANGNYLFEELKSGTCEVSEAQPAMYGDSLDFVGSAGGTLNNDNISDIALGLGVDEINYDFSEIYLDDISGHVWFDEDHDSTKDAFETVMLSGVVVSLKDGSGTIVKTTTTDANGYYEFLDYPLGTYQVVETQPANYGSSTPDMIIVNLRRGGSVNNDFGETQEASIAGVVYVDLDDDGVFDNGEYVIPGVEVKLTGTTGLGASVDKVGLTNASGGYIFGGLQAGVYRVVESQPAEYADGKEGVGSLGGVVGNDEYSNIVILGMENGVEYNFGELGGSIKVCTILDKNQNGVIEAGETGVAGQMVEVMNAAGVVVMTLETMSDGCVEKKGMVLGSYTVNLKDNLDYIIVGKSSVGVTLASTDLTDQINYTLQSSGWIKGCVYEDVDKDKVMDSTESKLAGVMIVLRDGNGTELKRMETWSNGCYDFGKSVFGNYKLEVVTKAGYTLTTEKLVLGAVTEANRVLVVDFGMVKELPKTGASNYFWLLGLTLLTYGVAVGGGGRLKKFRN